MRRVRLFAILFFLGAGWPALAWSGPAHVPDGPLAGTGTEAVGWWALLVDELTWLPRHRRVPVLEAVQKGASRSDLAAWAGASLVETLEGLSDLDGAGEARRRLGLLEHWALLGPFPNEGMAGFRSRLEVEEASAEAHARWPGRGREVGWQILPHPMTGVWIRPGEIAGPQEGSVYFLATRLRSRGSGDAWLELGADGAVWRAWLDGTPLAAREEDWGGAPWRDRVAIRLDRAEHTLVLKVASDEREPALAARIVNSAGEAWPLESVPAEGWDGALDAPAEAWPVPRVAALQEAPEGACDPAVASARALALRWLAERSPEEPWRPWVRCALEALEGGPEGRSNDALYLWWMLAEAADEPWQAEERLRHAASIDPPEGPTSRRLALHLLGRLDLAGRMEAREWIEAAESAGASDLPWGMARWFLLKEAFARHALLSWMMDRYALDELPPSVLDALEEVAQEVRREDLVLSIRIAQTAQLGDDPRVWLRALEMADRAGGVPDLEQAWEAWAHRMADDPRWQLASARLAARRGNLEEAAEGYRRVAERAPGHPGVLEELARTHLRAGEEIAAAEALERLLAVAPQRQGARDILERLRASEPSFQDAWREDVAALQERFSEPLDSGADLEWWVDQKVTRVHANGLATAWHQRAARIHTRAGAERMRSIGIAFTPDAQRVDVLAVRVRRPDGSVRERWSSRDVHFNQGPAAIYFDVQERVISVERLDPGDILEWEYILADVAFRNLFDDYYGDFRLMQDDVPRRLFRHVVVAPASRRFATNTPSLEGVEWSEVVDGEDRTLVVEAHDVPAVRWEPLSPGVSELGAFVHISTWDSWDRLADWYWNLVRDQFILSPEIRSLVAQLVEGAEDDAQRVERIHGWVVDNIRYVSLSFGIHGFRPYRTTECLTRRFGDCKDTAALLKVMLEEAGIPTELVLIRTRDLGRIPAHPPSLAVFNHAIVYVPSLDLWLDGTAAHHHATETPWVDQSASSLLVHVGRGGTFLESGVTGPLESTLLAVMEVDLSQPDVTASGRWEATGVHAPPLRRQWEALEGRLERMERRLQRWAPGTRLTRLDIEGVSPRQPRVEARFQLEGGAWGRREASHVHVLPLLRPLGLLERFAPSSSREHVLELEALQRLNERVRVRLPEGAFPQSVPEDLRIEIPEASVSLIYNWAEATHTLQVSLDVEVKALRIDPERYPIWRALWTDVERRLLQEWVVTLPDERSAQEGTP